MATQRAKKVSLKNTRAQVLSSVKTINCKVISLADDLVDETIATGSKYQKVATKAIRNSEPIIEKQVDMIFDTVEMTIGQIQNNSKRLQKLLGITKQVNMATNTIGKATNTIGKLVQKVTGKVEEEMDVVTKTVKKTVRKGKKANSKTVKALAKKGNRAVSKKAAPKRAVRKTRKTAVAKK